MVYFYFVTVNELPTEVTVNLMQVQTVVACDEGLHKLDVLSHLIDVPRTSRVVARSLYASREGTPKASGFGKSIDLQVRKPGLSPARLLQGLGEDGGGRRGEYR